MITRTFTPMENLMRLMGFTSQMVENIQSVCLTADGFYMCQDWGDIGYNRFLGRPSPLHPGPGRDTMLRVWQSLSDVERKAVVSLADNPPDGAPIPLADHFGVPVEGV